jgi:hypothetical protein
MLTAPEQHTFEEARRAPDPTGALAAVVRNRLKEPGVTHQELLNSLEEFRGILQQQGQGSEEDVVLEVMDFLVGWASPHVSLAAEGKS